MGYLFCNRDEIQQKNIEYYNRYEIYTMEGFCSLLSVSHYAWIVIYSTNLDKFMTNWKIITISWNMLKSQVSQIHNTCIWKTPIYTIQHTYSSMSVVLYFYLLVNLTTYLLSPFPSNSHIGKIWLWEIPHLCCFPE